VWDIRPYILLSLGLRAAHPARGAAAACRRPMALVFVQKMGVCRCRTATNLYCFVHRKHVCYSCLSKDHTNVRQTMLPAVALVYPWQRQLHGMHLVGFAVRGADLSEMACRFGLRMAVRVIRAIRLIILRAAPLFLQEVPMLLSMLVLAGCRRPKCQLCSNELHEHSTMRLMCLCTFHAGACVARPAQPKPTEIRLLVPPWPVTPLFCRPMRSRL
jgi:hypothetical protein